MATNHFGPFLLTHLLLDLIKRSTPARILVVTSSYHAISRPTFPLNPQSCYYWPTYSYCNSKLANIYFTMELSRRLVDTGVTVNCLHPGYVQTGIWRHSEVTCLINLLKKCFKTVKVGAETSIYLASSPEVNKMSGLYFYECKPERVLKKFCDIEKHKKLWDDSMKIVGISKQA
jgi:retinol dehydrogenase 14